jgi:hypothetical protein
MVTVEQVINDPTFLDDPSKVKSFFSLPVERMHEFMRHPNRFVRLAAVTHARIEDVPLFISDPYDLVRKTAASRLKQC